MLAALEDTVLVSSHHIRFLLFSPYSFLVFRPVSNEHSRLASPALSNGLARIKGEMNMSFLAWIILGLVAGFIGSKIVNKSGEGLILDIVLGVIGAVVGGWLFAKFGAAGVTGLNLYSIMVAVVGSIIVLVAYHMIRRAA
jgi:uncharacterized membrane protein YeaQ/YmgE (transglycosylase-associated protein family)